MRENCTSGSEGGGVEINRRSLPLSRLFGWDENVNGRNKPERVRP
jgi:hypothetical protein